MPFEREGDTRIYILEVELKTEARQTERKKKVKEAGVQDFIVLILMLMKRTKGWGWNQEEYHE